MYFEVTVDRMYGEPTRESEINCNVNYSYKKKGEYLMRGGSVAM